MTACGDHFRTQITRTTEALAASTPARPVAGASLLRLEEASRIVDAGTTAACGCAGRPAGNDRRLELDHADEAALAVERGARRKSRAAAPARARVAASSFARAPSRPRCRRPGACGSAMPTSVRSGPSARRRQAPRARDRARHRRAAARDRRPCPRPAARHRRSRGTTMTWQPSVSLAVGEDMAGRADDDAGAVLDLAPAAAAGLRGAGTPGTARTRSTSRPRPGP